ncbi:hypothetical protein K0M31_017947 [Melipona bicolor]|uniref:Uncharacterized protein n=1 Tax=Melipona bicolor TaxID=60889 RepID=A0AA40G612_9HYME|nr:hypothetical protein K0M31_017947 [Melipona bicolor]
MRPRCGHDAVAVVSGCIPAGIPLRISSFAIGSTGGTGYVTGMLEYPAGRVAAEHVRPPPRRPAGHSLRGDKTETTRGRTRRDSRPSANNIFMARRVGKIYTGTRYIAGLAIGSPFPGGTRGRPIATNSKKPQLTVDHTRWRDPPAADASSSILAPAMNALENVQA